MIDLTDDVVKQPRSKNAYNEKKLVELFKCVKDPLYFMKTFMKIQHPIKGSIPFEPYDFQEEMIAAFHDHRFSVHLCARQMGKSVTSRTIISRDGEEVEIQEILSLTWKEQIIDALERALIRLKT
jgi:hypothetical protein